MSRSHEKGHNSSPNDSGGSTERLAAIQFLDDYVISSDASPGAWVTSKHPVDLAEVV